MLVFATRNRLDRGHGSSSFEAWVWGISPAGFGSGRVVVVVLEDDRLGVFDLLGELGQGGVDLGGRRGQAQLGSLEEVEQAGPAAEEGRQLWGGQLVRAPEEELLDHEVEGERRCHAARSINRAAAAAKKRRRWAGGDLIYGCRVNEDERRLALVVEGILDSHREHGNINHLDGSNLPARSEVSELLDDLISVVFPGYFNWEQLDELTARYFVGARCARILRRMAEVTGRALRLECAGKRRAGEEIAGQAQAHALELLQAIPDIRARLAADVQAALAGDPAACSAAEIIMSYPGVAAIAVHRVAHHLYTRGVPLLPRMMSELVHSRTGIDIHPGATIGESFFIDHGTGVVVGETSRIGNRVKLYQGVTLGAHSVKARDAQGRRQRHPTIEDDVTVYAGATILGGDTVIGRGSTIGGNVWLTRSVPPGTTVVLDSPSLRYFSLGDKT